MRTVNYDLYKDVKLVASTTDFDRALEWKSMKGDHSFRIRLEGVPQKVSKEEENWRKKPRSNKFARIALNRA